MSDFEELAKRAREIAWKNFGKKITFYLPSMFCYEGRWGRYPAISVTGKNCMLQCDHCKGKLLEPMIYATTPEQLIKSCVKLSRQGDLGCLISGGLQGDGTMPWHGFVSAIEFIKKTTNLFISVHCGILDFQTAKKLKSAGVDQALIDVVGDDETLRKVYHVEFGIEKIAASLNALRQAGIPTIPHIVVGLDYGKINGEYKAIDIIKDYEPEAVVIVSLMPLPETTMESVLPPSSEQIAEVILNARNEMPNTPVSLGCARRRGDSRIDILAVDCGVNRIAIPSEDAIKRAQEYGLEIEWQETCCSLRVMSYYLPWL